jgi:leucyl aminopeptidase
VGDASKPKVALIGKGVMFDSGGLSLKPSRYMQNMKYDMTGAATVAGTVMALAKMQAPVNVVATVGLVENMPDGGAVRPDDIITSYKGLTVEITNTDAEGRLVLADILAYTQDTYKPKAMIDVATLTGAITIALGDYRAGLFSPSPKLIKQLKKAEQRTGERVWAMPMDDYYDDKMKSQVADVLNSESGHEAGSTTAAKFLQRFVNVKKTDWAHLDIAGMDHYPTGSAGKIAGATGYGVYLLTNLVLNNYAK